jgi:hypothetical protein
MVKTDGSAMARYRSTYEYTESAPKYTSEGLLYSGNPLTSIAPMIGKYVFCLPHIHGLSEDNGVSITYSTDNSSMVIHPYCTTFSNDNQANKFKSKGCAPGRSVKDPDETFKSKAGKGTLGGRPMYDWPQCSTFLITKQALLYKSEFISTM